MSLVGPGRRVKISRAAVLVLACALSPACSTSTYEPFDSDAHLRERFVERLGPEAAGVPVPFALDEELAAVVEGEVTISGGEEWRVEQILDFVFRELGLRYELAPTKSAVETFHTRSGNCLSFVNLFVGVARHRRLNPMFVEVEDLQRWNYHQGTVVSHGHIVAGMYIDGKLRTYDFLPYEPKSYRSLRPIDELQATAHFYNNLGAEALLAGDVERAERLLRIAAGLAPRFDKAVNNLGVVLMRRGRLSDATEILEQAIERSPTDPALLTNLARARQLQGQHEEANALLDQLEDVHHASPFFFVYRGELALARGEHDRALEYMVRALRRDNEVPEVHLGLAKVYLAVGELERARQHVERALRLDATHREARRMATALAARGAGR